MKKVKITVMRMAQYDDLIEKYENPIEHACFMTLGQVFIADGWQKPEASATAHGTVYQPLL